MIIMKKLVPFLLTLCFAPAFWLSCETANDNPSPRPSPQEGTEDSTVIVPDSFVADQDTLSVELDSVLMQFCLLNGLGDTTTTFREDDHIIFDLNVTNLSDTKFAIFRHFCVVDSNLFRVFSSDGKDWGIPWEYSPERLRLYYYLAKGAPKHVYCAWNSNSIRGTSNPIALKDDNPELPIGHYRAVASMAKVGSEHVLTCVAHFDVIPSDSITIEDCYKTIISYVSPDRSEALVLECPENQCPDTPEVGNYMIFPSSDISVEELVPDNIVYLYLKECRLMNRGILLDDNDVYPTCYLCNVKLIK